MNVSHVSHLQREKFSSQWSKTMWILVWWIQVMIELLPQMTYGFFIATLNGRMILMQCFNGLLVSHHERFSSATVNQHFALIVVDWEMLPLQRGILSASHFPHKASSTTALICWFRGIWVRGTTYSFNSLHSIFVLLVNEQISNNPEENLENVASDFSSQPRNNEKMIPDLWI